MAYRMDSSLKGRTHRSGAYGIAQGVYSVPFPRYAGRSVRTTPLHAGGELYASGHNVGTHFKGSARGKRKYVTVRPQGQHARNQNKAIFAALPLVAQEWLGSVRELSTLDTLDTTALNFKRKEFEKIYSKHLDNLPFCPELLTHTATINGHQSAAILDTNETR